MWNAVNYFETLNGKLKTTKNAYHFCRVSGINGLEEILANYMAKNAFLAVDDSDDGMTIRLGGGYFNRRSIVVYVLKKYKITDMSERETALSETRSIRNSLISKLLVDANNNTEGLNYLNKERIPYHEVPGYFAAGTTGIYFIITIDEPVNLAYNANDWTT